MSPRTPHGTLAVLWVVLVLALTVLSAVFSHLGLWWLTVACWVVAVPVGYSAGKEAAQWKNAR